jgi:hypothetical protein
MDTRPHRSPLPEYLVSLSPNIRADAIATAMIEVLWMIGKEEAVFIASALMMSACPPIMPAAAIRLSFISAAWGQVSFLQLQPRSKIPHVV